MTNMTTLIQSNTPSGERVRVSSIDALRAIILLGILLVHALGGFGFPIDKIDTINCSGIDKFFDKFISYFLSDKCAVVFNVLFGVSFYFILKRPCYPSTKFVWRCVLLFGFGLFNKLFYTNDALCWYAFWGIILVFFRNMKPKHLLLTIIILKVIGLHMPMTGIGEYIPWYTRYEFTRPFYSIVIYRHALTNYLAIVLSGSVFGCLSNFIIGYCIGKMGWMEQLDRLVTKRLVGIAFVIYLVVFVVSYFFHHDLGLLGLSAGFFYSVCVIYAYYHIRIFQGLLHYLEAYGKMGLTNYSMQGIFGVIYVYFLGRQTLVYGLHALLGVMLLFYVCQAVFSHLWLKSHKYGPFEYLWRSITERRFIDNRISAN